MGNGETFPPASTSPSTRSRSLWQTGYLNDEDVDKIGIYSGAGLKISIQKELDHVSVNRPHQRHSGVSFKLT